MTPVAQPKLNYLAPEYALTSACDPASDMFAVGVLIHALHNGGRTIFDSMGDWSIYKKNADQVAAVIYAEYCRLTLIFIFKYIFTMSMSLTTGTELKQLPGFPTSHTSWRVLEILGFFLKIPGPGKSWKITLVLESPGN